MFDCSSWDHIMLTTHIGLDYAQLLEWSLIMLIAVQACSNAQWGLSMPNVALSVMAQLGLTMLHCSIETDPCSTT